MVVCFFNFFNTLQLSICSLLTCTCKQKLSPEDCVNFHIIDLALLSPPAAAFIDLVHSN